MPTRTIYVRPEHVRLWVRLKAVADRRSTPHSTLVAEAIRMWLDKNDPDRPAKRQGEEDTRGPEGA